MSTDLKQKPAAKAPTAEIAPEQPGDDGYSKRIEQIRAKRRERGTQNVAGYKLRVDTSKLDPRFEHRWVNEENCQLRQAEATFGGDWEFLPNTDGILDDGRNVEQGAKIVRVCDRGTGKRTVLMRKPKELYQDDQRIKNEKISATEGQMKRQGANVMPKLGSDDEDNSQIYTPKEVARAYRP